MKSLKKITILLLVLAVGVVAPLNISEATAGVNANAQIILAAIEAAGVPETFVIQTKMEFLRHDVHPTDAETAQILDLIASAEVIGREILDSGLDILHPLNILRTIQIVALIEQAANIFCLTAHVDVVNQTISATPIPYCVRDRTQRDILCDLVAEAETIEPSNYTPRSWSNLQSMIVFGRNVCNNPTAVEVQIIDATNLLRTRINELVER